MKIVTLLKQGVLIVRVEGELDMHVADEFRKLVDDAIDSYGVKNVILNLQEVSFIDSSGLGVILGRYKRISHGGGQLAATNVQPQVTKIFELSGLLTIIKLYESENQALARA